MTFPSPLLSNPPIAPPVRAVHMSLFPTFDSLDQAIAYAEAHLPLVDRNTLIGILMSYQNTLLKDIESKER